MICGETAHIPNFAERSQSMSERVPMKALSGRVRILKNSKLKLRVGLKKRDAMTSDTSKDKSEEFLSGVVEGKRLSLVR